MCKYLLVLLVIWCKIQRYVFAQYTSDRLFTIPNPENGNLSTITEELSKKPVIAMSGNNNYNVGQQVFYICDEKQFNRILLNNKHSQKMNNAGLTKHKLVTRKVIWNTARQTCKNEGGYLAIINSEEEEQLLLRMLKDKNINEAWLGVHDLYQEGEWITIHGEALEDTGYSKPWATNYGPREQPDSYGGHQNCALLVYVGGMDDNDCNIPFSFFCEMPV